MGRCCVTGGESVSREKLNVRWDLCGHDMRKPVVHNPRDRSSGQGVSSLVAKQGGGGGTPLSVRLQAVILPPSFTVA